MKTIDRDKAAGGRVILQGTPAPDTDKIAAMLTEQGKRPRSTYHAPTVEPPPPRKLTAAQVKARIGGGTARPAKVQPDADAAFESMEEKSRAKEEARELKRPCTSIDVAAWLDEPDESDNPLIEGLVECGSYVALVGPAKAAKTWLEVETAVCVAAGVDWFGRKVKRQRVYVANVEVSPKQYKKRVRSICRRFDIDYRDIAGWLYVDNRRGHAVTFDDCYWEARRRGAEVAVLDPFYQLFKGRETDEGDCQRATEEMKRFLAAGMTLICVFHAPKGYAADRQIVDMISGSSVLARFPENVIAILPHATEKDARVVDCSVLRDYPPPDPFTVKFDDGAHVLALEITPELKSGSRYAPRKSQEEKDAERVKRYAAVLAGMTESAVAFVVKRGADMPNTKTFSDELRKQYGESAVSDFVSSVKNGSIEGLVAVEEDRQMRKADRKKGPPQVFITTPERADEYATTCNLSPLE